MNAIRVILAQAFFLVILNGARADFLCTTIGRFANPSDATCQTYYVCSKKSTGEYVTKSLSCASSQSFDPSLGKCSSTYECKNLDTSTATTTEAATQESTTFSTAAPEAHTTEQSSTTLPYTTVTSTTAEYSTTKETITPSTIKTSTETSTASSTSSTTTESVEEFVCTKTGRFKNPTDKECKTYYLCSIYGSSLIKTLYKCPSTSTFDPDLHKCNVNHVCYYTTTQTTTTTTESTTTLSYENTPEEPSQMDFTCYSKGRFANENDRGCKWYYLCNSLRNGSYIQTPYSCPTNSVFNPEIQLCSNLYNCPLQTAITLGVNLRK